MGETRRTEASEAELDALMDRFADGENAAFEALYDGLAPRLFGYLLRRTHDRAAAEDVVQQTMLRMHRARGRFIRGAKVVPWAYAIARRLLVDAQRRERRSPMLSEADLGLLDGLEDDASPADAEVEAAELAGVVRRELERMPENQRAAFELVKQEGLSMAEAAAVLGTTVSAVKLRAHRAYQRLRAVLADVERRP